MCVPLIASFPNFDFGTLMIAVSAALRTASTTDVRFVALVANNSTASCAVSSPVDDQRKKMSNHYAVRMLCKEMEKLKPSASVWNSRKKKLKLWVRKASVQNLGEKKLELRLTYVHAVH